MPAPTGNTNAEKWNPEKTIELIENVESLLKNEEVYYLGQALGQSGAYAELWSRLKRKYQHDEDIYDRMMVIDQLFEAKIVGGSMTGKYHFGTAQLVLKSKYGFSASQAQPQPEPAPAPEPATPAEAPSLPPVPTIEVVPSWNAGTFRLETKHAKDYEYIISDWGGKEIQRGKVVRDIQRVDMVTDLDGCYYIWLKGPQFAERISFTVAEKKHHYAIHPVVFPD